MDIQDELQVYAALSGDEVYTGFWSANLSGFQALPQTLARTEVPRRMKPFHLSFAARSAVDYASRSAVRRALDLARASDVVPVTAARYADAVTGFMSYTAVAEGPSTWRIEDRGDLQTLRFDGAGGRVLDLAASEGVLGARRKDASLYVALDPGTPAPRVVLVEGNGASGIVGQESMPALVHARAEVLAMDRAACVTRMTLLGYGEAEVEWLATPTRTYEVTLYGSDGVTRDYWKQIVADEQGRLAMRLPLPTGAPAEISITDDCSKG